MSVQAYKNELQQAREQLAQQLLDGKATAVNLAIRRHTIALMAYELREHPGSVTVFDELQEHNLSGPDLWHFERQRQAIEKFKSEQINPRRKRRKFREYLAFSQETLMNTAKQRRFIRDRVHGVTYIVRHNDKVEEIVRKILHGLMRWAERHESDEDFYKLSPQDGLVRMLFEEPRYLAALRVAQRLPPDVTRVKIPISRPDHVLAVETAIGFIVEKALQSCCPDAPDPARLGAVTFVHRFGSALNGNLHFHCCVIDGLFSAEDEALRFDEAAITREAIAKVQAEVRERILRLFERRSLLSPEDVETMRRWGHEGGFSLNASVTVAAWDRAGLERLFRYCARPIFASERLQWIDKDRRLVYRLPKPRPDGQSVLYLTPLAFLDKLAGLIPPPRKHRHRFDENPPWFSPFGSLTRSKSVPDGFVTAFWRQTRQAVTAYAGLPIGDEASQPMKRPLPTKAFRKPGPKRPPMPHPFGQC